jgi:hypothetical protein
MTNLKEALLKSELRTDILKIAFDLQDDPDYTKEDALNALLQYIEKHEI